ncbi:MAG: hypothetical protein HN764_05405 [Gammaproteobacteria bacterium]|jgi:hypothetical protein|nr:hypothetical protein [Gammaproteobacteria bacterium]
MSKLYIPSKGPKSWKEFLADPEKQWSTGYSARSMAYCWEEANGFPKSILAVFQSSDIEIFKHTEIILGIPEHKVSLPGRGFSSQNDLFVLARSGDELISIAVEGKVSERFDNCTVEEWLKDGSYNKHERIKGLTKIIGLTVEEIMPIRYQLIHRTASALLEANRFCTHHALMMVHSFSQSHEWFDDYAAFAQLYGVKQNPNELSAAKKINGIFLYLTWVTGEAEYLEK